MNSTELNNQEINVTEEDILNVSAICQKEKLTKEEFENELLLLIFCKMCYEEENELSIKREDLQNYAPKLEELFSKLGLPCNQFVKTPVSETYDQLRTHILVTILKNNYGYINNDYNKFNLTVNRYYVINNLKKYKKIDNIIDMGYRIITNKPLVVEEPTFESNQKELSVLAENIDMINLVSNPNEHESITFKQYFELFIDYQKYLKQKLKEIFYLEYLDDSYDDISITRYLSDKNSTVLNLEFKNNVIKKAIFEKEKINDTFRYIWDKAKIIKREKTLDNIFDFAEENKTFFDRKNSFFYPSNEQYLSVLIFPENKDRYKTLSITYEFGKDRINIKSEYLDDEMTYELYINGTTINILNDDIEPILDNLYINIDFLPQYMQDYIVIKERKNKRKQRKLNLNNIGE